MWCSEDDDCHRRFVWVVFFFFLPRAVGLLQGDQGVSDFRVPIRVAIVARLDHRLHGVVV